VRLQFDWHHARRHARIRIPVDRVPQPAAAGDRLLPDFGMAAAPETDSGSRSGRARTARAGRRRLMVEAPNFPLAEHPRLRPIEVFPIEDRGERCLVLRDPSDPEVRPIVLSDGAAEVLMLLDGERTLDGLSAALQLRGASISTNQIRTFLQR